jgi:hypothetical protein
MSSSALVGIGGYCPMKIMSRREARGRFLHLSIPDLIRDPGKGKIPLNLPLVEKRSRGRLFAKGRDEKGCLDTARF